MIGLFTVAVHRGDSLPLWSQVIKASRPLKAIETAFNVMPTQIAINVIGDMNPGYSLSVKQYNEDDPAILKALE